MLNNLVNKLPEIQDLLKAVTTENKTFSFDALHYQKQTIKIILETATEVGKKIRNHWRIENQLHWVKDVIMDGDSSKIKQKQGGIKGRAVSK
ncbi:hypothetical protein VKI22_15330 [Cyanobacterium aponinum UTEX 3221]|nr:hypothetical protein [Cyanobacterium aponinum]WRL40358.1 hypothetical protein VKI22_15330 [Cyanobacterium aponinum UTEX 3221]